MVQSLRILILEDNPDDAEMVRFELQEAGLAFTAKVVMTEKEFIHELDELSPDLILSDYDLPRYSGDLALAEARKRRPDTPFILVTGAIGEDRAIQILTQGAKDYVLKNRLRQRLVPAVRRALAESEEHRARQRAEAELRETHRTLEERVQIRTAELEAEMAARKSSEAALQKSEETFRLLVENAPDAIYVHADARFVYLNPAAVKLFGAERAEHLIGSCIMERYSPDYHEMISRRLHDLYEERKTLPIVEQVYIRLDGGSVPVEARAVPINYNDQNAALTFACDITERKRGEEEKAKLQGEFLQAQKMESVGRLAGGVAHDFNNMLGVILGHAEMAMDKAEKGLPLVSNVREIRKAAERSAELTRQLLAFARKQMVSPRVLDLNGTVAGMLKMLQRLIGEDIHLEWLPGTELWPVRIDPSQIDQILANLSVNARDAIAGVGKVAIETKNVFIDKTLCVDHPGMVPGEYVLLAMSDDGCGMDREIQGKLFEPFFTTKGVGKGTGLGLSTVYGIVKQNDGFIAVESEPDQGTTFRIYLPRHIGKNEQAGTEGAQASVLPGHETVLVVEDEPALLELSKLMLEKQGYRVLFAGTPGEAIRLAGEHAGEIHLLLTDVVMPEMDGRTLARKMLSLYPNLKRLFMSGYSADVIAHRAVLDEGAFFIQKPFSVKELAAKVREALGGTDE